jgi:glucokinase
MLWWLAMSSQGVRLGIDLGGTKIAVGLVDRNGKVRARHQVPTPAGAGPSEMVGALAEAVRAVCQKGGVTLQRVAAVGVGAPGPVDRDSGVVVEPPNLPGCREIPLRQRLGERLGLPVRLDNDANAAGLAEARFGAGRGRSPLIYFTVSTGIGGALLIDGEPVRGAAGAAGELGHLVLAPGGPPCGCGGRGCLEALASGTAIAREARARLAAGDAPDWAEQLEGPVEGLSAADVATRAATGDPVAEAVIREAMRFLGYGVAGLVNALNPAAVVIGGGLTALGPALFDPVRSTVDEHCNPVAARSVTVARAALGADAGIIGAAALTLSLR